MESDATAVIDETTLETGTGTESIGETGGTEVVTVRDADLDPTTEIGTETEIETDIAEEAEETRKIDLVEPRKMPPISINTTTSIHFLFVSP